MKTILVLLSGVLVIFLACDKDKFESKPTISIKSFSPEVVDVGESLRVSLEVTDKEGDVEDSLVVIRERLNKRAPSPKILAPLKYKIPEYPDNSKVEMEILLPYFTGLILNSGVISIPGNPEKEPDTLNLKFFVRDLKKNTSDTIAKKVIVLR